MHFRGLVLATVLYGATATLAWNDPNYKYVALFSVDGLHSSDVGKYVSLRPQSTIAQLLATGYEYTNAFTSGPSDSFPGSMNQFTGASPRTTGVWYDDVWDRSYYPSFAPNNTRCEGPPGAEGPPLSTILTVAYADNGHSSIRREHRLQCHRTLLWRH